MGPGMQKSRNHLLVQTTGMSSPDLERRKAWTRDGEAFRFNRLEAISAEAASWAAGAAAGSAITGTCRALLPGSVEDGLYNAQHKMRGPRMVPESSASKSLVRKRGWGSHYLDL